MAKYEILDDQGKVINTILASEKFVKDKYPGRYVKIKGASKPVEDTALPTDEEVGLSTQQLLTLLFADQFPGGDFNSQMNEIRGLAKDSVLATLEDIKQRLMKKRG